MSLLGIIVLENIYLGPFDLLCIKRDRFARICVALQMSLDEGLKYLGQIGVCILQGA